MLKKKVIYCQYRIILKRYFNVETCANEIPPHGDVSSRLHIFQKTPFRSYRELSSYFLDSMVFNENGLIVLNKPYGLKKEPEKQSNSKIQPTISSSVSNIHHLSFSEAVPALTNALQIEKLNLVKLPERYISGISFLSSDETVTKKIKKCFGVSVEPLFTYLALCVGIPKQENNFEKLGITLQVQNNLKRAILVQNYSKRSLEKGLVTPLVVRHNTLSVNEDLKISLVQLTINRNKWHGLRLYLAIRLFAPCLGDTLLGPRVKYINNVPILADPFNPGFNSTQTLPNDVLTTLQVRREDQNSIPLHLHLSQVNLPRYNRSGKTFIAKPPEHFLWSCERLGISVPEFYLKNSDLPFTEPPKCGMLK